MADKDDSEKTIATDIVVTKYKMAGEMVNRKLDDFTKKATCEAHAVLLNYTLRL